MTRYLCIDPSHGRGDRIPPVDLTPRVRTELGYLSRHTGAIVATREVIEAVAAAAELELDRSTRAAEIRRILTGSSTPTDGTVTLIAPTDGANGSIEGGGASYELPRRRSPSDPREHDVIRLPDAAPQGRGSTVTATRTDERETSVSLPSGTFLSVELASRLSATSPERTAIIRTIAETPTYEASEQDTVGEPWRVVVECPEPEGVPPSRHRVVFAGTGEPEDQGIVFGTPAGGWDLVLEDAVGGDLAPPLARKRAERVLGAVLVGEVVIGLALLAIGWAAGGLGLAARESPGWLGLSIALALGALGVGLVALIAPRETEGNSNDMLVVDGFYRSRTTMLWTSTIVSAGVFLLALLLAVVPPMTFRQATLPAPSVAFDTTGGSVRATVSLIASDVSSDDLVTVEIATFADASSIPAPVGLVTTSGNSGGSVEVEETFPVAPDQGFLAVVVSVDGPPATCTPAGGSGSGCTVVAVPEPDEAATA